MLIPIFNIFFYISTVSGAQYGCFLQFLEVLLSRLIIVITTTNTTTTNRRTKNSSGKYKLQF